MLIPLLITAALAEPEDQVMVNAMGAALHWPKMPVDFKADPANAAGLDEDGAIAAIVAGAGAWTWVEDAEVEYRFRGVQAGLQGGYDEANVVYFSDEWVGSPDLLALTSTWSDDRGIILDFDLAVNTQDHEWSLDGSVGSDLQNALTHEFGHALGFGHDEVDPEATMFPSASPGETSKRDLAESDLAMTRWLYPALVEQEIETVDSRSAVGCAHTPVGALGLLAPAALLVIRRRGAPARKEAPCSSRC